MSGRSVWMYLTCGWALPVAGPVRSRVPGVLSRVPGFSSCAPQACSPQRGLKAPVPHQYLSVSHILTVKSKGHVRYWLHKTVVPSVFEHDIISGCTRHGMNSFCMINSNIIILFKKYILLMHIIILSRSEILCDVFYNDK